ncbi:MAG: hypothetical protein E5Y51_22375 [Mesorhizobium sp.]|nr:MAG: hypothetical protein E5Y51_22375 [Mesorhizobium sp.]
MNNETFAIRDDFSNDLEVPYTNNHLRFVITDRLPWAEDEATAAHLAVAVVLRFHYDPAPNAEMALSEISKRLASDGVRLLYGMAAERRRSFENSN